MNRKHVAAFLLVLYFVGMWHSFSWIRRYMTEQYTYKNWINTNVGDVELRRKHWRLLSSSNHELSNRLPDVVGIGVRKCGTGALQRFISFHPLVKIARKEAHYYDIHHQKGLEFYRSLMPPASKGQLIGEKTPAYFRSPPFKLPRLMLEDLPNVKLWLILCDPVKRAYSDFVMRMIRKKKAIDEALFDAYLDKYIRRMKNLFTMSVVTHDGLNRWNDSLIQLLSKEPPTYTFAHGIYAYYIKRWLDAFPAEQLYVVDGEELLNNPGDIVEQFQSYLNIPTVILRKDFVRHPMTNLSCVRPWWDSTYNFWSEFRRTISWEESLWCSSPVKGRTRSANSTYQLSSRQEYRLRRFFKPYSDILYNILGQNFKW